MLEASVVCPVLIGRHTSLDAGYAALTAAGEGTGSTLLIAGEAGIGKSRLLSALVEQAKTRGFVTLMGACFEADRSHPYAPILDLVRVLSAETSPALVAHAFAPAADDLVTLFPELQPIFADTPPRPSLGPEEDRRRFFHSFGESVRAIGKVQPLLLVLEDVHWSDDATLDLVLHLARRIAPQPIALILTFRSDEIGPRLERLLVDLDRARCAAEIQLRPLGVAEVSAMLHAIFGSGAVLDTSFAASLQRLTEGNPFFVEEMLKALVVAGDLVCQDGVWRAGALDTVRVPRTATEAVGRRLAGLSASARRVADVAAVAGRRFDFTLLQALTEHEDAALLTLVKELIAAQLVVEESADRFVFRHALTRESIRTQLLSRERIALHRAIAAALEARFDESAHDMDDDLAYHTYECGLWDSAVRYSRRAADQAWTLCAPREVLQQLDRAVSATERSGKAPDAALLAARGRARETLGLFPQAHEDFTAAHAAAQAADDRTAAWSAVHALGMLWAARDYERAGQYRRDALALAREIGDPMLLAHSLNRIGNWFVNREDPTAGIPHHDEALAIFERAGDPRGVAQTVDLLAMAHHIAGAEALAVTLYERAVELFTALEDRRGLANALAVLGVCGPSHHASAGPVCISRHADDLLVRERAPRIAADIGWRAGDAFARYLLADCLAWRGEWARALRLARESLTIAEELEHLEWQCGARRVLGVVALDLCDHQGALVPLGAAYEIAQRLASATWIRWTGAPYAIALARAGESQRAIAVLDQIDQLVLPIVTSDADGEVVRRTLGERFLALARAECAYADGKHAEVLVIMRPGDASGTPRVGLLRAQALHALGRRAEALSALATARADADAQGSLPLRWRIDALEGSICLAERRRLDARRWFDEARQTAHGLAAQLTERESKMRDALGDAVDRLAPPPAVRTERQRAKETFDGLTQRERETVAQVALGKSNREIAATLGIGERTAEGHVASAMAKLGCPSRAALAVWAVERGLVERGPTPGTPRARRGGSRS